MSAILIRCDDKMIQQEKLNWTKSKDFILNRQLTSQKWKLKQITVLKQSISLLSAIVSIELWIAEVIKHRHFTPIRFYQPQQHFCFSEKKNERTSLGILKIHKVDNIILTTTRANIQGVSFALMDFSRALESYSYKYSNGTLTGLKLL